MFSVVLRFRSFLRRYRLPLSIGAFFTLASSLVGLAQPWPLAVIVDSVLKNEPVDVPGGYLMEDMTKHSILLICVVAYMLVIGGGALSDYLGSLYMNSSGERLVADLRESLFSHMQRMSLRFHTTQRAGDLISRVMTDIDRIETMLVESFATLIPNVAMLVGMVIIMLNVDWSFTLLCLSVLPLILLTVWKYRTGIKSASRLARKREGQLAARTGEVLGAIRVVQAFTREDFEDERFSQDSSDTLRARLDAVRLQAQFSPIIDIISALGTAIVLYVGTTRVLSGELELGHLLVFVSYISSLYKPIRSLSKLAYVTSRGVASAERISEVLDAEDDVRERSNARLTPPLAGRVELEGVELAYDVEPVLHDIELVAEPGQVIALVGPTGAGKSSLVSLIPRFFDPRKGRVVVDGHDVRDLKLYSLRSQVGMVLQEPLLFEGTIYENILYGRPEASEAEVLAAAKAALVDDFVARLPKGYETRIAERGVTLSGGERQRVSIARALLRDAPVLILDEPTSQLDPSSEHLVMMALRKLMEGRTSFVIAHRMSTVAGADQVLVLDHGRIVERGSHEELIQLQDGMYRSFLEMQLSGSPPPSTIRKSRSRRGSGAEVS